MEEKWVSIKDFIGLYEVSNMGNIRSTPKQYNSYKYSLIKKYDAKPYFAVRLYKGNKAYRRKVHRLVAIAFIENVKNKKCVNHLDGDKYNNILSNLEWATHSENTLHAYKNGLNNNKKGENNGKSKIDEKSVMDIVKSGLKRIDLARIYKVSLSTIDSIKTGNTWGHITKITPSIRKRNLTPNEVIGVYKSICGVQETISTYSISRSTYFKIKSKTQWTSLLKGIE